MTYDLTAVNNADGLLEQMQAINDLTTGILGNGWSIVIFIIILLLGLYATRDFRKSILASGSISFVLSLLFLAAQLITMWLAVFYLVMIVIGIILLQDKDLSS